MHTTETTDSSNGLALAIVAACAAGIYLYSRWSASSAPKVSEAELRSEADALIAISDDLHTELALCDLRRGVYRQMGDAQHKQARLRIFTDILATRDRLHTVDKQRMVLRAAK